MLRGMNIQILKGEICHFLQNISDTTVLNTTFLQDLFCILQPYSAGQLLLIYYLIVGPGQTVVVK